MTRIIYPPSPPDDCFSPSNSVHRSPANHGNSRVCDPWLCFRIQSCSPDKRNVGATLGASAGAGGGVSCWPVGLIRWRPVLKRRMLGLLDRLASVEARVRTMNECLAAAGRSERIAGVEFGRARPRPGVQWEGAVSLAAHTIFPDVSEWSLEGRGHAQMTAAFWNKPTTRSEDCPRPIAMGH